MLCFRYHGTNCFFIRNRKEERYLAVDAGWPGTLREYQRALKELGIAFSQVKLCIVTHLHMDHAGLITDFQQNGIRCFLTGRQTFHEVDEMERAIRKNRKDYKAIDKGTLERVSIQEMNRILQEEGFPGEVMPTDGHSPDSISFVTENQEAIIGDLAPPDQILDDQKSTDSWTSILERKVRMIYPSHADIFEIR